MTGTGGDIMAQKKVGFRDKGSRKMVWMSHCLLDQNVRFPGIAVAPGALEELIKPLIDKGIGLEQLPCAEYKGWGGINRMKVVEWDRNEKADWIVGFGDLCQRLAKDAVDDMEDAVKQGYQVLGVIAANSSPSCGITRTMDFPGFMPKMAGMMAEVKMDFSNLDIDKFREIIPKLLKDGSGQFMGRVADEIKRRGLNIPVVGFNLWADFHKEREKVFKELRIT
jgi:uncharacterized protein YbbK (DUF523 family)